MLHNGHNAIAKTTHMLNEHKQFTIEAGKSYACYEGFGGYVVWFGSVPVQFSWKSFDKYFKLK